MSCSVPRGRWLRERKTKAPSPSRDTLSLRLETGNQMHSWDQAHWVKRDPDSAGTEAGKAPRGSWEWEEVIPATAFDPWHWSCDTSCVISALAAWRIWGGASKNKATQYRNQKQKELAHYPQSPRDSDCSRYGVPGGWTFFQASPAKGNVHQGLRNTAYETKIEQHFLISSLYSFDSLLSQ